MRGRAIMRPLAEPVRACARGLGLLYTLARVIGVTAGEPAYISTIVDVTGRATIYNNVNASCYRPRLFRPKRETPVSVLERD